MRKRSRRPNREAIKAQRSGNARRRNGNCATTQKAQGLDVPSSATISNRKCPYKTAENRSRRAFGCRELNRSKPIALSCRFCWSA